MEEQGTVEDFSLDFLRLYTSLGFLQSDSTPSISREYFNAGRYFKSYDLTTSSLGANSKHVLPSVRTGNYKVDLSFDKETPIELTMVMFVEYPAILTLGHKGTTGISYVS
jgi:hypothetical protein